MGVRRWGQIVETEAAMLAPRLYEGMSIAIPSSETRARGLMHAKYPHLRPLLVRCELREYLEAGILPVGWQVEGNPGLMGQLLLVHRELGLHIRILKERRKTYPQGVPAAGRNPARRAHWQAPLPTLDAASLPKIELLLLWDYSKSEDAGVAFTLRIVHTTEAGVYGKPVKCDLDLEVVSGGTIFETLSFAGDDDREDFFSEVEIDKAENDE